MKKLGFLLTFLMGFLLFAQNLEIEYSGYIRQRLPDEVRADFLKDAEYGREQLKMNEEPEAVTYKLLIAGKESNFNYIEKISNDQDPDKPVIIMTPFGFGTVYNNLETEETRQNFDVYGKKYHSVDPLTKRDWKITRESKEILGYEVRKATAEDEDQTIIAWYAPKINISNGPADFTGLPGLVLEAETQFKEHPASKKIFAVSITPLKKKPKIKIPDKGDLISVKDIDKIWEEANNQRNEMYRSSQGVDKE